MPGIGLSDHLVGCARTGVFWLCPPAWRPFLQIRLRFDRAEIVRRGCRGAVSVIHRAKFLTGNRTMDCDTRIAMDSTHHRGSAG